jgi:cleavage and polyadenylation specificity factor subunit 2
VLLSHSPSHYLSLYPYARAHWGLKCPVYATQPTVEMGRVVCLSEADGWRSECAVDTSSLSMVENGDSDMKAEGSARLTKLDKGKQPLRGPFVPTVEEIHEAFDWIKAIRYNQPLHLGGRSCYRVVKASHQFHALSMLTARRPIPSVINAFPFRSYPWWIALQAQIPNIWHSLVCRRNESYGRAPHRWYGWR